MILKQAGPVKLWSDQALLPRAETLKLGDHLEQEKMSREGGREGGMEGRGVRTKTVTRR